MNSKTFKRDLTAMSIAEIVGKFRPVQNQGILDKDLYYKFTLAAAGGTASVNLFQDNAGSLATTNIDENGKMAVNRHQLVEGINVTLVGAHGTEATRLADVNLVADKGILVIEVGDKTVFRGGPLRKFIGQTALTKIDTTSGDQGYNPFVLVNPILLEAGKTFKARVDFPGSGSPVTTGDVAATVEFLGQEISVQ